MDLEGNGVGFGGLPGGIVGRVILPGRRVSLPSSTLSPSPRRRMQSTKSVNVVTRARNVEHLTIPGILHANSGPNSALDSTSPLQIARPLFEQIKGVDLSSPGWLLKDSMSPPTKKRSGEMASLEALPIGYSGKGRLQYCRASTETC